LINRVLQKNRVQCLDKSDYHFHDPPYPSSDLHRQGIGAVRKSASIIKPEEEDHLWEKGSLGTSSPRDLQNGLQLVLRGVQEQHDLLIGQIVQFLPDLTVHYKDVYYKYTNEE
jgi:hypothetical protein